MKVNWRVLKGKTEFSEQKFLISQVIVMKFHHWRACCWRLLCSKSVFLKFNMHKVLVVILPKFWFSRFQDGVVLSFFSNKLPCDINKYHIFHILMHYINILIVWGERKQIHIYHIRKSDFNNYFNTIHPKLVLYLSLCKKEKVLPVGSCVTI